jgi:hypothetical protein
MMVEWGNVTAKGMMVEWGNVTARGIIARYMCPHRGQANINDPCGVTRL